MKVTNKYTYVIFLWGLLCSRFNNIGDEAEEGTDPQKNLKTAEQIFHEMDPFRCCFGRCQNISSIFGQIGFDLMWSQALKSISNIGR